MFIIKYFDEWQRTQNNSAQLKLLSCVAYIINENHHYAISVYTDTRYLHRSDFHPKTFYLKVTRQEMCIFFFTLFISM